MLAETRKAQGRGPEAVALLQKGIAARVAAGQKPTEDWYKRAVALAYEAKLPVGDFAQPRLGRGLSDADQLARHACASIKNGSGLDDDVLIDLMRLQRATGALAGETDYYQLRQYRAAQGLPG